jgi:uncharacterized protein YjbI with pentapeptide repeats
MANTEQVAILRDKGVKEWDNWREAHPDLSPDLSGADLSEADLRGADLSSANLNGAHLKGANFKGASFWMADLSEANLRRANLVGAHLNRANLCKANLHGAILRGAHLNRAIFGWADLSEADLSEADLSDANLNGADLSKANLNGAGLRGAHLRGAHLNRANLSDTDLSGADLHGADLNLATLIETNLEGAILTGARVYGISVWDVKLENAVQTNLVITPELQPEITVDNLEVAQFIYLLLNNERIRHVLDTITSKVVLILGRFTPERKVILDALREELRHRDYLPVLFDFEKPSNRDITETVSTLAHMAQFVIADLSDPKSIPHELARVIPLLPSVPIMPVIVRPQEEYSMFEHFFGFRHVLKPFRYRNQDHLMASLETKMILPAEKLAKRLAGKRSKA